MAIPKICGIETEYAIIQPNVGEQNPIHASSVLVNAYAKNKLKYRQTVELLTR